MRAAFKNRKMNHLPVVRIELESMKHTLQVMLQEHAAMLDADINRALESCLSSDAMAQHISAEVERCIKGVVTDAIKSAFGYSSAGRAAIREAVMQRLDEEFPMKAPRKTR